VVDLWYMWSETLGVATSVVVMVVQVGAGVLVKH